MGNSINRKRFYISVNRLLIGFPFLIVMFTGCVVGPDYQAPLSDYQIRISEISYPELRFEQTDLSRWWDVFNDPLLSSLISRAEQNNLDLKIALARIREARAVVGIADSGLYPVIDANGAISWGKESENVNPLATGEQTQYQLSAEAGWEIDLFGRIRRSIEAAAADYQATWEEHRDVLISVRAEVAEAYLQIRTLQAQLLTARDNIASQRSMLELTDIRYQNGLTSYLDVAQATQILAATEAELPLIRLQLAQAISRVGVLLGESTDHLRRELEPPRLVSLPPQDLAVGIPADRIRQRPDVRSAERRLAAQTARIGVATADLYPSFSLTGILGFSSLETGNFFDSGSQVYGLGPSFRWNIFNMGRIRQQISVEDARTEQALHFYEQSMLRAIKEVEDSLVGYHEQRLQFEALERSVEASLQTLEMSTQLYKDGLTSFQDVLDAQRSLFAAEKNLDAARGQTGIQLVGLYRALAGGWTTIQQDSQPSI